jgi:hypothetical protein
VITHLNTRVGCRAMNRPVEEYAELDVSRRVVAEVLEAGVVADMRLELRFPADLLGDVDPLAHRRDRE